MQPDLQSQISELRSRLDLTETRVGQLEGRFEFVSGQLRDIQLYMHRKFGEIDQRFDRLDAKVSQLDAKVSQLDAKVGQLDAKFSQLDAKVDALPRVLAEMLDERERRRS